ncbi:PREDICTED: ATP synthase subunit s, mitochondrial isoform X1 [Mandrillus leucophaeus]|uniref:ATP synthase subunit s, mitochondrial isoform X1 n=2 Tax=Mandrillus leucophaeus TaxID=9568 RepID=UPI0005F54EA3|nr:PREDICTED: ATP synthase subunit s, mitochondrial isoform X1 [Mandrillus leucophaeus]
MCCAGSEQRLTCTDQMMLFGKVSQQLCGIKKLPWSCDSRYFWGWLNAVFNKVDYDRIRDVGPDRAASEWLLRCGAMVRYHGQERWQMDYNHLPTGPLDKYKIQAIDATNSCIMSIGFDHLGNYPIILLIGNADDFAVTILLQLTHNYSHRYVLFAHFSTVKFISSWV